MMVIVDSGMGNLQSIKNIIRRVGGAATITDDPLEIERASKIILPGVGAFDAGMTNLASKNLIDVIKFKVKDQGVPILGICLGMQLLTRKSEEGKLPGLGLIDAETVKFSNINLKIPHMGWNQIIPKKDHPLINGLTESESRFYFVHSYYVKCFEKKDVLLESHYGLSFTAALQHENIMGTQFHPEKSHKFGMALFQNFCGI